MTPDEARKDYPLKDWTPRDQALYTQGFKDGYEAAQRERGPIQAVGKPRSANGLYYGGDAGMPRHFASETNYGRPGR